MIITLFGFILLRSYMFNLQVYPTLKLMKSMSVHDQPVRAEQYLEKIETNAQEISGYDSFQDPSDEKFDTFSLRKLLKDYLHADPSTRYFIGNMLWHCLFISTDH